MLFNPRTHVFPPPKWAPPPPTGPALPCPALPAAVSNAVSISRKEGEERMAERVFLERHCYKVASQCLGVAGVQTRFLLLRTFFLALLRRPSPSAGQAAGRGLSSAGAPHGNRTPKGALW